MAIRKFILHALPRMFLEEGVVRLGWLIVGLSALLSKLGRNKTIFLVFFFGKPGAPREGQGDPPENMP